MTLSNLQARRATIDDLAVLRNFWMRAELPASTFEKRLTEFQVVETVDGTVLGAIGLQVENLQGKLYSEVYAHLEQASVLRPRLWERIGTIARQRRLSRLWIEAGAGMFWLEQGFEPAGTETLKKLPPELNHGVDHWLTLPLLDEEAVEKRLDQELAVFRLTQARESERVTRQVLVLRLLAGTIVTIVFVLAMWAAWWVLRHVGTAP